MRQQTAFNFEQSEKPTSQWLEKECLQSSCAITLSVWRCRIELEEEKVVLLVALAKVPASDSHDKVALVWH